MCLQTFVALQWAHDQAEQKNGMSGPVVAILGTRYLDFAIEHEVLAPLGATFVSGAGSTSDDIVDVAGEADLILAGARPRFDATTQQRLSCRAIVRYGVGVDSVDLEAAASLGRWVVRVPDYGTEAVALHAFTLALAGVRRLGEADRSLRVGGWGFAELRPLALPSSLTAGVVGFGRIGRRVAELFQGAGFGRLLAHDPFVEPHAAGVEAVSLERVIAESDVLSLHAPGPPDGTPLFDAARFATMRPGSVLVNTARGGLIDSNALVGALTAGRPRLAALDVFSPEPPDLDLFATVIDRMILTPHMAWYTEETEEDLRRKAAAEALRILSGEEPLHPVVRPEETR